MGYLTYETISQCSGATGTPKEILKAARSGGCPGFVAHRVQWDIAEPWIKEHYKQLETYLNESLEEIKRQNLIKDGILKDLEIQKRKGEYLIPSEVKEFLIGIATAQSSIMKKWPAELAPKLAGKNQGEIESILNNSIVEVMSLYKVELSKFIE